MALVRRDAHGLYLRTGGYIFRPGPVIGFDHAYDMGDGGLMEGDRVRARHLAGSEIARIRTESGDLHWSSIEPGDPRRRPADPDGAAEDFQP